MTGNAPTAWDTSVYGVDGVHLPEVEALQPNPGADERRGRRFADRFVQRGAIRYTDPQRGLLAAPPRLLFAKRALDVLGSALLLLVMLPLLLLTAIAVWGTSAGPVLYVQERIGRAGRPFRVFKFRSMYRDAEERRADYVDLNEVSGPVFKIRRDPRVTPVGRVIRKLSIDELPQLFNVLKGEMSLVGPRPPLPEEYERYTGHESQRLLVKPGLTCIWQVSGRSDIAFDEWVAMDLLYIESWSPRLDFALILRTIPAVLSGRGAY